MVNILVFIGDCWNLYGAQITQIFMSGLIIYFSSLLTLQLTNITSQVQMVISNAQLVYMNEAPQLYNISLQ